MSLRTRLRQIFEDQFTRNIIFGSFKLILINLAGAFILFFSNYILIKLLGDVVYGQYVTINVWLGFFLIIALFGIDDFFVVVLPKLFFNTQAKNNTFTVFKWALKTCLAIFLLICIVLGLLFFFGFFNPIVVDHKIVFFVLLGELLLLGLLISFFRAISKIIVGQTVDKIIRPCVFVFGLLIIYVAIQNPGLTNVLWLQMCALMVPILILLVLLFKSIDVRLAGPVDFDRSGKTNFTFLGISILYLVSMKADILVISAFMLPEEVGYYNLAARIVDVIGYPLIALNLMLPTLISKEYNHNKRGVADVLRNYAVVGIGFSVITIALAFLLGKNILSIFGPKVPGIFWPMIILSGTQLFFACASPINAWLMISGKQRFSLICLFCSAAATLILCYVFIPLYGSLGAAFSTLAGSLVYMIALIIVFSKYYKFGL